ncbi:DUF4349 domain-containing protein [Clostridiaceae bacterium 35-E11]
MKCMELEELISLYIDDMLDDHSKNMIEAHLQECMSCRTYYEELLDNIHLCQGIEMVDVPEDFAENLHAALLKVEEYKAPQKENTFKHALLKRKNKKINWKAWASMAAVLIVIVFSMSFLNDMRMGSMEKQEMNALDEPNTMEPMDEMAQEEKMLDGRMTSEAKIDSTQQRVMEDQVTNYSLATKEVRSEINPGKMNSRKVIQNAFIYLDIKNYDEKLDEITHIANRTGGYIESANTQYKNYDKDKPEAALKAGNIVIRIPEDKFMDTVEQIKILGTVTNFEMQGQDITREYRDTVNQIENLKIQEKRLREIMEKTQNVKEILEVERELTRVRGELNEMTGDIKRWDDLVNLSTIHVSLNEILSRGKNLQPVNENIWIKAKQGFIQTTNDMIGFFERAFIVMVSILPFILFIGTIGIPFLWYIAKKIKKKSIE